MIERILPPSIVAVEAFEDASSTLLFPEEHDAIRGATQARIREFSTARTCARAALARLGVAPVPVLSGPRGAPEWPDGVVGSITHCDGYRAAAVARDADVTSLGIDAEPDEALPEEGMLEVISLPRERKHLRQLAASAPGICWERMLFSAKESVYKAWFPLARRWLGFEEADILFDAVNGTFSARLLIPGPTVAGSALTAMDGCWMSDQGLLLTSVVIRT